MEQSEKERIREIKRQASYDRKARRAIRKNRFRGLKNFIWWLSGVLSSFVLVAVIAFITVGVIPIGTYFGEQKDEMVSENISEKTVFDIFKTIDQYKVSDFKVLQTALDQLIADGGIDEFVTIDQEKLGELQFVYPEESGKTIGSEIQNCIRISKNLLGDDIAKIGIFDHAEVPEEEVPAEDDAEFNPKLYYYVSSGNISDGTAVYSRAYDDDRNRIAEDGQTLYYVSLDYVPFGEMKDLIGERMGVLKLTDILTALGNDMTGSPIAEILGDTKVNGIGNFDINSIKLNILLPNVDEDTNEPINTDLYDLLCSAIIPTAERVESDVTPDNLTIGDITGKTGTFDLNSAMDIQTLLGEETESNAMFYAVLRDLAKAETNDDITFDALKNANFNDIHLSTVLPYERINEETKETETINSDIYKILCDAITRENSTPVEKENLTIGDLNGATGTLTITNIHLTTVLDDNTDNEQLYDILREATGETDNADITIGSLSKFNIGSVKFSTAMKDVELGDNKILSALMQAEDFTINKLGTKVNELEVSALFDVECFTTDSSKANVNVVSGSDVLPITYKKVIRTNVDTKVTDECYMLPAAAAVYQLSNDGVYTYQVDPENLDYYISTEAHVLLFLLYDYDYLDNDQTFDEDEEKDNHDENGNALIYIPFHHQLQQLQTDLDTISSEVMFAKIRQLADSGILDDNGTNGYKEWLYKISIGDALNKLETNVSA